MNKPMRRVAIVAAMHGDEVYGIELYNFFVSKNPNLTDNIKLFIGNNEAYEKKIRFIDIDLNRAFDGKAKGRESIRAKELLSEIVEFNPDLIIDVHTTRRNSGVFILTDKLYGAQEMICNAFPGVPVLIVKDAIIKTSFIGNTKHSISIEYPLSSINKETTHKFNDALYNLINNINPPNSNDKRNTYTVERLVSQKEFKKFGHIKNFDKKGDEIAMMIPEKPEQKDAEYFGFWCKPIKV